VERRLQEEEHRLRDGKTVQELAPVTSAQRHDAEALQRLKQDAVSRVTECEQRAARAVAAQREACAAQDERLSASTDAAEMELQGRYVDVAAVWQGLQSIPNPHELHAAMAAATAQAAQLDSATAAGIAAALQAAIDEREGQLRAVLTQQAGEFDAAVAAISREQAGFEAAAEQGVQQAEAAHISDLDALRAACQTELSALLQRYAALMERLSEERIAGREARQAAVAAARERERAEHAALRAGLGADVAALEMREDAARASNLLTGDKLEYNCRVMGERAREDAVAAVQQKRMANRLAAEQAALSARHRGLRERAEQDRERLERETRGVEAAVVELDRKAAHFRQADAAEYAQVVGVKEAELSALLRRLAAAEGRLRSELGVHLESRACAAGGDTKDARPESAPAPAGESEGLIAAVRAGGGGGPTEACSDATTEAFWRRRVAAAAPPGLSAELELLEAEARRQLAA
jgi:hypothetical protein